MYVCAFTSVSLYVCKYPCMYPCMYTNIYEGMHVNMYDCMYVCKYVQVMYDSLCVDIYAFMHSCMCI